MIMATLKRNPNIRCEPALNLNPISGLKGLQREKGMKLVTFSTGLEKRVGVLTNSAVVDLKLACEEMFGRGVALAFSDMRSFLSSGDLGLKLAKDILEDVVKASDGDGRDARSKRLQKALVRLGEDVHIRAPINDPQKILCPAVNYMSHSAETNVTPPKQPYFFGKFANTIIGPDDPILIPKISDKVDYEVELAAVIGKRGKNIPKDLAYEYIVGYTILNDISFRDLQGWPQTASVLG